MYVSEIFHIICSYLHLLNDTYSYSFIPCIHSIIHSYLHLFNVGLLNTSPYCTMLFILKFRFYIDEIGGLSVRGGIVIQVSGEDVLSSFLGGCNCGVLVLYHTGC